MAEAPRFEQRGIATVQLPRATGGCGPQWVAEGSPISVGQGVLANPTLGPPKKAALIETMTRELSEANPQGGEAIIEIMLRDACSRGLDMAVFSATAGSALRPPGILSGVTPATASTGAAGLAACLDDLAILADAVVAGGVGAAPMFFASPGRRLNRHSPIPSGCEVMMCPIAPWR
jgi:hypothetical protein